MRRTDRQRWVGREGYRGVTPSKIKCILYPSPHAQPALHCNPVGLADPGCDCFETALSAEGAANRFLHLIETFWSFCIPVIAITYMDARVLICGPQNFLMADTSLYSNPIIRQRSKKVLENSTNLSSQNGEKTKKRTYFVKFSDLNAQKK
jgi:hypothetical protein